MRLRVLITVSLVLAALIAGLLAGPAPAAALTLVFR